MAPRDKRVSSEYEAHGISSGSEGEDGRNENPDSTIAIKNRAGDVRHDVFTPSPALKISQPDIKEENKPSIKSWVPPEIKSMGRAVDVGYWHDPMLIRRFVVGLDDENWLTGSFCQTSQKQDALHHEAQDWPNMLLEIMTNNVELCVYYLISK